MTIRRTACGLAVFLLGITVVAAAGDIRVTPLVTDRHVSASFDASPVFDADAREMMRSGLLLTFNFVVELRRPSTIWLDRTLAEATVAASVKFDNLTGVYQVSKLNDSHVVWSERTQDEADVLGWMTQFERVLLQPLTPLESNEEYYVRVRLRASPRRTFSFWPWNSDDGVGRADFTFLR